MLLKAYTVYDRKALQYYPPFFSSTDGAAVRMFSDLANDATTNVGRHPGDYQLYRCGEYDDAKGALIPLSPLDHVADAVALVAIEKALPLDVTPSASFPHDPVRANGEAR